MVHTRHTQTHACMHNGEQAAAYNALHEAQTVVKKEETIPDVDLV
jgi:hypothetical protein